MTVLEAVVALKENADHWSYFVPEFLFRHSEQFIVDYLLDEEVEDYQNRANSEWEKLIQDEADPIEAAEILMAWIEDIGEAIAKRDGSEEIDSDPYQ